MTGIRERQRRKRQLKHQQGVSVHASGFMSAPYRPRHHNKTLADFNPETEDAIDIQHAIKRATMTNAKPKPVSLPKITIPFASDD